MRIKLDILNYYECIYLMNAKKYKVIRVTKYILYNNVWQTVLQFQKFYLAQLIYVKKKMFNFISVLKWTQYNIENTIYFLEPICIS